MTHPAKDIILNTAAGTASGRRPTLTLDVAFYEEHLTDSDLDETQKRALLEALWAVIVGFVDLGFAVEPATERQDEPFSAREELADRATDLVECEDSSTTNTFRKAAVQVQTSSAKART